MKYYAKLSDAHPIVRAMDGFRQLEEHAGPYDTRIDMNEMPSCGIGKYLDLVSDRDAYAESHWRDEGCLEAMPNYDSDSLTLTADDGRQVDPDSEEGEAMRRAYSKEVCVEGIWQMFDEDMTEFERGVTEYADAGNIAYWVNLWFADPASLSEEMTEQDADRIAGKFLQIDATTAHDLFHPATTAVVRPADIVMVMGLYMWTGEVLWDTVIASSRNGETA